MFHLDLSPELQTQIFIYSNSQLVCQIDVSKSQLSIFLNPQTSPSIGFPISLNGNFILLDVCSCQNYIVILDASACVLLIQPIIKSYQFQIQNIILTKFWPLTIFSLPPYFCLSLFFLSYLLFECKLSCLFSSLLYPRWAENYLTCNWHSVNIH